MNLQLKFPEKNAKLAELMGVLTGDGFMNYYPKRQAYIIEITGNKLKDKNYLENYVSGLFLKLFNFKPKFYLVNNQNTIRLVIRNKEIFSFIKSLNFPLGKKGQIVVPSWVLDNEKLMINFIRGMFDTDGHLCLKNKEGKKYPVIGITSISLPLLKPIRLFLDEKGISSYLGKHNSRIKTNNSCSIVNRIQISGKKNIGLFFDLIGSNNSRNLNKYQEFLKL